METITRFFKPPNQSFFLFGPRGTGKSTLLKCSFSDAMYIDLLDPEAYRKFSAKPERLGEMIEAYSKVNIYIIDEVQNEKI